MNKSMLLETLGNVSAPRPPTSTYSATPIKDETPMAVYQGE